MSIFKRVPWVSLALVLLSYSTLGWVISEIHASKSIWLAIVVAILFLLITLTTPLSRLSGYYNFFFKSNTRSLVISILVAFFFFLMLVWFQIFLDTLLIISATILIRIDLQAAGFKEWLSFGITSIFSLAGLALGALVFKLI